MHVGAGDHGLTRHGSRAREGSVFVSPNPVSGCFTFSEMIEKYQVTSQQSDMF
jgi:hypothetical protein